MMNQKKSYFMFFSCIIPSFVTVFIVDQLAVTFLMIYHSNNINVYKTELQEEKESNFIS